MQVLGDLLNLPPNEEKGFPVPWWCRAPLGLTNDTVVYVGLTVKSEDRPVPDLIVTVLNTSHWSKMFQLDCLQTDQPGVVAEVFKSIYPLNIALTETVKMENGLHHITLICEPVHIEQEVEKVIQRIVEELEAQSFKVTAKHLPPLPELTRNRIGQVEHGWITGVKCKEEIRARYPETANKADLSKVVVSADTESRVLRFVFPRKGAMTLTIRHADEPGALAEITKALKDSNLNILSALSRRGGGRGVDEIFIAVCEPEDELDVEDNRELKQRVTQNIFKIDQAFRPDITISDGRESDDMIYCRHPEEIVARVPRNLSWRVQEFKDEVNGDSDHKKPLIFVSRRFVQDEAALRIAEDMNQALADNGCIRVEAPPTAGTEPTTTYTEVSSRMWAAHAGIVLITDVPDKRYVVPNLAHELGFLLGQGKSVLMLIEDKPEVHEAIRTSFTNLAGVVDSRFKPEARKEARLSVYSRVSEWIEGSVLKSL